MNQAFRIFLQYAEEIDPEGLLFPITGCVDWLIYETTDEKTPDRAKLPTPDHINKLVSTLVARGGLVETGHKVVPPRRTHAAQLYRIVPDKKNWKIPPKKVTPTQMLRIFANSVKDHLRNPDDLIAKDKVQKQLDFINTYKTDGEVLRANQTAHRMELFLGEKYVQ
jgi:hypothetical protein